MFIGNIVDIVQHSHLYNSFLLVIVACIVILLVGTGKLRNETKRNENKIQRNL